MAGDALKERGWYLTEDGIVQCTQNGKNDVSSLIKVALDTDLRDIGKGWLPEDVNRGRAEYVEGPGVLQLQKIRNVSAPKDNEESQAAPRLMKLVLTDGHTNCTAVETEIIKDIGLNTAPGSKIKLKVTTAVEHGFLLLNNKNTQLLGGRVDKLAEGWELKKKLAKQQRATFGEGGPPPFVPFGKRIDSNHYRNPSKRDNFKSLEANKGEKKGDNEDEFEQQRKATIAEALQAKEDGTSKRFGGGQKQIASDHDIAKITEMGFRPEEASAALRSSNGNLQQAIDTLLNQRRGPAGRGGTSRQSSYESRDSDRGGGRGRRDRRDEEEGPGRGRRGRDMDQGEEPTSRPSGPATLFDFLETKMPVKESKDSKKEKETKLEEPASSQTNTSDKSKSQDRDRPRTSGQNQSDSWSQNQSSRRPQQQQQDIPPRFVNKKQEDQSYRQGRRDSNRPKTAPNDFRSSDRNYDDRNYNDRKFNDRNYNDRNYNDRKYNDRNYNERNYNDRNYNERNYNDRKYNDRNERNYERNYNDRNYNDRSYSDRNYNDRNYNDRNYNERNYYDKNYSDRYSGRGDRKDNQRDDRRDNFRREDKGGKDSQNTRDTRQNYDRQGDNYQKNTYSSKSSASTTKNDPPKEGRSNQGRDAEKSRPSQNQQASETPTQTSNISQPPPPQKNNHQQGQDQSQSNQGNTNKPEKYPPKNYNNDSQNYETENQQNQPYYNNTGQVYNNNPNSQVYVQEHYSQGNINTNNYHAHNPQNYQTSAGIETYATNGSYVNPQMSMELQMSSGPPQFTQPPADAIYTVSQVQISFKRGDRVMAKYWEDGLFYEAVIESVWPNLPTCVVTFVEYGNSEEVMLTDIRPMIPTMMGQPSPIAVPQPDLTVPPPQVFYSAPPPQMSPIDEISSAISSMEFRRGGSGPVYPRKHDNRPQQQFYQPPVQRR